MERSLIGRVRLQNRPFIPVCCICQRIRTLDNRWEQQDIPSVKEESHNITHAFCPECIKLHYPLVCDDAAVKKPV
jgi:hypothetical protein